MTDVSPTEMKRAGLVKLENTQLRIQRGRFRQGICGSDCREARSGERGQDGWYLGVTPRSLTDESLKHNH